MFADMSELETVDLSNFNMSNVNQVGEMFDGDIKLRTIYANSDLIPQGSNSFRDWLKALEGANLSRWKWIKNDGGGNEIV